MILFENSLISLDYNPSTDILEVGYPDLHDYLLPEIKHSINILIDKVKHYDVKRILLDSSKTVISVGSEESRQIAVYLAAGLVTTRVQKVARLQSPSYAVEQSAEGNIQHIKESQQLPFLLQNFTSKAVAIDWLQVLVD
ncbi:hypothetical protein [Pontibacter akesuensis]|uniref:SpoIIAA-like n=1 Tax=Pontibacter akesuensis TaxID=388950 RepID=A0A1I7JMY3_9BACT|nr:hypothetical protein [Pontibacter akesuensis]GHA68759.1 hypothetical protein GCM10007389_22220 [Pontibacter akesuensis]SFU86582.1 hypothetical protein SAMN04487941_3052 [Pontibacter akesuensis]